MIKAQKRIEVDAPVEQVFAYINDPARVPEFMPGSSVVKDIHHLPDGRYTYTVVTKLLGLPVDLKTEQVEVVPNERIVEQTRSAGMDGTVTNLVEPLPGGKTRLSLGTETTLHAGPLAKLGEAFLTRYFNHLEELGTRAVKAHIEAEARGAMQR